MPSKRLIMNTCELHLDLLQYEYYLKVSEYAEEVFNSQIKPFCISRGWRFISKGCRIGPLNKALKSWDYPEDKEWQEISGILETIIPGDDECGKFGSLMPDYGTEDR